MTLLFVPSKCWIRGLNLRAQPGFIFVKWSLCLLPYWENIWKLCNFPLFPSLGRLFKPSPGWLTFIFYTCKVWTCGLCYLAFQLIDKISEKNLPKGGEAYLAHAFRGFSPWALTTAWGPVMRGSIMGETSARTEWLAFVGVRWGVGAESFSCWSPYLQTQLWMCKWIHWWDQCSCDAPVTSRLWALVWMLSHIPALNPGAEDPSFAHELSTHFRYEP